MIMNKKEIITVLVVVWLIAMTGYFVYDVWGDYKIKGVQKAYNQGIEDMTVRVIDEVGKKGCEPIEVYAGEKKVQIANAQCLPAKETANTQVEK